MTNLIPTGGVCVRNWTKNRARVAVVVAGIAALRTMT
jgi:hypothetical protein